MHRPVVFNGLTKGRKAYKCKVANSRMPILSFCFAPQMKRCQLKDHMAASAAVHFIPLLEIVTGLKEKVEMLEQKKMEQQATIEALQGEVATLKPAMKTQQHGMAALERKVMALEQSDVATKAGAAAGAVARSMAAAPTLVKLASPPL